LSSRTVIPAYRLAFGLLVLVAIVVQMVSLGQAGAADVDAGRPGFTVVAAPTG